MDAELAITLRGPPSMLNPGLVEARFQTGILLNSFRAPSLLLDDPLHGLINQRMEMGKLVKSQADLNKAEGNMENPASGTPANGCPGTALASLSCTTLAAHPLNSGANSSSQGPRGRGAKTAWTAI